jgi:hypothetical protein
MDDHLTMMLTIPATIERGWIKGVGMRAPFAPFVIGEGVHAEMDECVIFQLLPCQLRRRGRWSEGRRRRDLHRRDRRDRDQT